MSEPGTEPHAGPPPGPPGRPLPSPPPAPSGSRWWAPVLGVVVLLAVVAAVIAIAQAAGDDDATTGGLPGPATATAAVPATTSVAVPVRTAPPAPADGVTFRDPQGAYTLAIDADWADMSSRMPAGTEAWAVGRSAGGFTPNVNVVTQAAADVDLDNFLATSVNGLDAIDADLTEQAYVPRADGTVLGAMRYSATPAGGAGPLEFLAVFDVRDGTAVVATLTGTADVFDALVADVEPYLLTLEATG